jgi:hypothetical protein
MGCDIHFVTVGHHKSQGNIERFHSTLIEHIQFIQEERNVTIRFTDSTRLRPLEVFHGDEECRGRAKDITNKAKHKEKTRT